MHQYMVEEWVKEYDKLGDKCAALQKEKWAKLNEASDKIEEEYENKIAEINKEQDELYKKNGGKF